MEIQQVILTVKSALKGQRLNQTDEKQLQRQIGVILSEKFGDDLKGEYHLDKSNKSIIDFFVHGVGIEVKIKGVKRQIYKQCERYCGFDQVKALLLITNIAIGFPEEINQKDCYVLKLGRSWL